MSDEDKKDNKQEEINEKISLKLVKIHEARKANNGSRWTTAQEVMQEIVANHTVINPNKLPSVKSLRDELISEINRRYAEDEEFQKDILDTVPTAAAIGKWLHKEEFDSAVWSKIRSSGLFTKERRADMINALFRRGMERDTQAAKIWLQLSGDLKDDTVAKDKTLDTFREINQILNKKDSK